MELRIREMGSKYVVTDYARAGRIVDVVQRLDFVREIFLIGDQPVAGCTLLAELLDDPGDGKFKFPALHFLKITFLIGLYTFSYHQNVPRTWTVLTSIPWPGWPTRAEPRERPSVSSCPTAPSSDGLCATSELIQIYIFFKSFWSTLIE
jgi:hypothetical protein